jgi:hypothetical protein
MRSRHLTNPTNTATATTTNAADPTSAVRAIDVAGGSLGSGSRGAVSTDIATGAGARCPSAATTTPAQSPNATITSTTRKRLMERIACAIHATRALQIAPQDRASGAEEKLHSALRGWQRLQTATLERQLSLLMTMTTG